MEVQQQVQLTQEQDHVQQVVELQHKAKAIHQTWHIQHIRAHNINTIVRVAQYMHIRITHGIHGVHGAHQATMQHTAEHVHVRQVVELQHKAKATQPQAHGVGVEVQQQVQPTQQQEHVVCAQKSTQELIHQT